MMLYDVTYYTPEWTTLAQFDCCVELVDRLDVSERALARCVNWDGHSLHWNGHAWRTGAPAALEKRWTRQENEVLARKKMALLSKEIVGVTSPTNISGGYYPRHPMLGKHVLLRRTDPDQPAVLAEVRQVLQRWYRVWLPEHACEIVVQSDSVCESGTRL